MVPADPTLARGRSVINVIVPEGRAHFFQQLGYVLATLLLFILLLITVVLATRQRRRGGEQGWRRWGGSGMQGLSWPVAGPGVRWRARGWESSSGLGELGRGATLPPTRVSLPRL